MNRPKPNEPLSPFGPDGPVVDQELLREYNQIDKDKRISKIRYDKSSKYAKLPTFETKKKNTRNH